MTKQYPSFMEFPSITELGNTVVTKSDKVQPTFKEENMGINSQTIDGDLLDRTIINKIGTANYAARLQELQSSINGVLGGPDAFHIGLQLILFEVAQMAIAEMGKQATIDFSRVAKKEFPDMTLTLNKQRPVRPELQESNESFGLFPFKDRLKDTD